MIYGVKDYPLSEKHPDTVIGARGKKLSDITLDAVIDGIVTIDDLRITPRALGSQADIARDAGRPRLGNNFERAAELVGVPQNVLMHAYEMLRPGRAKSKPDLLEIAATFRNTYRAEKIASFIEEAAGVYERRGLFSKRY